MIRKKLAFFAEEVLKRATDTMWGLSDIKMTELLQKIPRYLEHLFVFLLWNSTNSLLFMFPFCCLSCKKQIEKRQRLVVNIITVENDLRSRQFLDENFFFDSWKKHNISRQTYSFLEVKLWRLRRRTCDDKYDISDKNLPTVLANSSNHSRARCHNIECK